MQKHKPRFLDVEVHGTQTDIQRCLRLNDLDEVGDGTHYLDFHMLGLFSFRDWPLQRGIDFWMRFLESLGIPPDRVTVPPHRPEWKRLYLSYGVRVDEDKECVWSDGMIGGDCTEFYRQGVELGNLVHPLGTCLDGGFGVERLQEQVDDRQDIPRVRPRRDEVIDRTIRLLVEQGVTPSPQQQGYVLRKLLRQRFREGWNNERDPVVRQEFERWQRCRRQVDRLRQRGPLPDPRVLWETYGLHPDDLI